MRLSRLSSRSRASDALIFTYQSNLSRAYIARAILFRARLNLFSQRAALTRT
jgi:hypothetical protein